MQKLGIIRNNMASEDAGPFPASRRVRFKKNPLVQVICQLRFPTILDIGASDPAAFQEAIRSRYPLYEREDVGLPKEIGDLLARLPGAKGVGGITHKFLTEDSKRYVSLTNEFVALSESEYTTWDDFRSQLAFAKSALEAVHKPAFYSRLGLRYQDVIKRANLGLTDVPWHELLTPAFSGFLAAPETRDSLTEIGSAAVITLGAAVLGGFVRLQHGLTTRDDEQVYAIDADFFTEERSGSEAAFDVLDEFSRLAGHLFRWAITPRLHEALDPVDLK